MDYKSGTVSGSRGSEYDDDCLLGCCAVSSGRILPTFQRAIIALIMEAVRTSETSVNFYETTRCSISGGCYIITRCREKLKFHTNYDIWVALDDVTFLPGFVKIGLLFRKLKWRYTDSIGMSLPKSVS
jgi:hypothetical protein